jgi:penicillin amidase
VSVPNNLGEEKELPALPANYQAFTGPVISGMSNCYVLGADKVVGASAILVNGPQFGWFNPGYVYSIGLHGAGIDVAGNTPFAYPMILFGHNKTITWGSTWGAGDIVDIYAEQLNPSNSAQYLYLEQYRDLEHRVEEIAVAGGDPITIDIYRSVHGPIVHEDNAAGVVYAKHRAWEGREIDTLLSWIASTRADDFAAWKRAAADSALNVNMYFADVQGNIGYFHGGRYPQRAAGHDNRLPVTGDGRMDWLGRVSPEQANPHVLNPSSGFLANWNNKPAHGVMNPDFYFYSWSSADRVELLESEIRGREQFKADDAWALIKTSSHADVHAPYLLPLIAAATVDSDDQRLKAAGQILQRWDRSAVDQDRDGYCDGAATAIFRKFVAVLLKEVLSDNLGDVFEPFSVTGYPTAISPTGAGTNIQTGMKAVIESLSGRGAYDLLNGERTEAIIAKSLVTTLDALAQEQGANLDAYRLRVATRPFSPTNFLGVPQAGGDELLTAPIEQNRGTENNMMVMRENAIVGWEVTPPGQSAFVSPAGIKSAHYSDQFELYNSFGKKRIWFYPEDVQANKVSEKSISYSRL